MRRLRRSLAVASLVAAPAAASAAELPAELRALSPSAEASVIVRFAASREAAALPAGRAEALRLLRSRGRERRDATARELKREGAAHAVPLWLIDGLAVTAPVRVLEALAERPEVESMRVDRVLAAPQPSSAGATAWNLAAIGADALWAMGYRGAGVVVATLDTGADLGHPDLAGGWRGGSGDWFDPWGQRPAPGDASGHGTQVLGLIAGTTTGVAPQAQWIAARIYDDSGRGTLSAIHLALQWVLDPDGDPSTDDAPDVVNGSWGFESEVGVCDQEFRYDVQVLRQAGIVPVFSAGNAGPYAGTSVSPANYPESLSVGAVDASLAVASFSSRGPSACGGAVYPSVVAPGVGVRTTDLTLGGTVPNAYASASGTSFAAPAVSGGLALLLGALPGRDVEAALIATARDLGPAGSDAAYGNGAIDLEAAWDAARATPVCTDGDRDGFFVEAGCGGVVDCNDANVSIFPGATEVRSDGVDQDCNGYDLTIEVLRADYQAKKSELTVEATSARRAAAALRLDGFGSMSWDSRKARWSLTRKTATKPATVTVSGPEGSVTVQTR